MRKTLIIAAACVALTGCKSFPIQAARSSCSSLVPQAWRKPVPGAPLPEEDDTVGSWVSFGDQQTAQLDKANDRHQATIEIISGCERRDQEAVAKTKPKKVFGLF